MEAQRQVGGGSLLLIHHLSPFPFISVGPVLAIPFTPSSEVVLSLHLGPLTDCLVSLGCE